jgi:transposase-like protein
MKEFECKGCGASVCVSANKSKVPVCPECRGAMVFVGETENSADLDEFTCPECKQRF